jgi:hypothetical protein
MTSFAEANRIGEAMPGALKEVELYKMRLEQQGAPTDGRAITLECHDSEFPSIHRTERIWLIGSRVVGELHSTGLGHNEQGWFRRIVDVDLESGELDIYAESQKGAGGGSSNIITGEDFWPMIDGVKVRQLQSSMYTVWKSLLLEDGAQIE